MLQGGSQYEIVSLWRLGKIRQSRLWDVPNRPESRPMTELFVEATAELPWLGGWAVVFNPLEINARYEAGQVQISCNSAAGRETLRWNLEAGQVRFSLH